LWRQLAVVAIGAIATLAALYVDRPLLCRRAGSEVPLILSHPYDNDVHTRSGSWLSRALLMLLAFQWLAFAACLWYAPEVYLLTFVRSVLVTPSNGYRQATEQEIADSKLLDPPRRGPANPPPTMDPVTAELTGLQATVTA
jgi:hypothetical protein